MTPDPDHLIERAAARLQTVHGLVVPEKTGGDAQRKEVVTPPPGPAPAPSLVRLPPVPAPPLASASEAGDLPASDAPSETIAIPNVPEAGASPAVSPPQAPLPATAVVISLGELRRIGLVIADNSRSRTSEEYRIIADRLRRNVASADRATRNLVMVTSARPGEGKSFTALNLAASIARSKAGRALLVDADIGPNALSLRLGLKDRPGLHDLVSDAKLRPDPFVLETELPGLHILPLGHPARVRNGTLPYGAALERLTRRYMDSVIVLDTPPALSTSDPHAIAPHVAQVVLVVEAERTQRSEVEAAFDLVRACPSVSAMLNKTRLSASHTFGSRDGYYYAAPA
jgi:receptor protein-tyrosine kinase